jgi:hypothetical protein
MDSQPGGISTKGNLTYTMENCLVCSLAHQARESGWGDDAGMKPSIIDKPASIINPSLYLDNALIPSGFGVDGLGRVWASSSDDTINL